MSTVHPKYKNSAAFYDVDGTLIRVNIVHAFAYYAARHASLATSAVRSVRTALSVPVFWAADKLSRKWFNEIFYQSYQGASEDRLLTLADELFEEGVDGLGIDQDAIGVLGDRRHPGVGHQRTADRHRFDRQR